MYVVVVPPNALFDEDNSTASETAATDELL